MGRVSAAAGGGLAIVLFAASELVLAGGVAGSGEGGRAPSSSAQGVEGAGSAPLGPPGEGRATVTWTAPTQRTDGSCLGDLAGFVVKWGPMRSRMDRSARLSLSEAACSPTGEHADCGPVRACRYTVDRLGPIKWYFTVTAVDEAGAESAEPTAVFIDVD